MANASPSPADQPPPSRCDGRLSGSLQAFAGDGCAPCVEAAGGSGVQAMRPPEPEVRFPLVTPLWAVQPPFRSPRGCPLRTAGSRRTVPFVCHGSGFGSVCPSRIRAAVHSRRGPCRGARAHATLVGDDGPCAVGCRSPQGVRRKVIFGRDETLRVSIGRQGDVSGPSPAPPRWITRSTSTSGPSKSSTRTGHRTSGDGRTRSTCPPGDPCASGSPSATSPAPPSTTAILDHEDLGMMGVINTRTDSPPIGERADTDQLCQTRREIPFARSTPLGGL